MGRPAEAWQRLWIDLQIRLMIRAEHRLDRVMQTERLLVEK